MLLCRLFSASYFHPQATHCVRLFKISVWKAQKSKHKAMGNYQTPMEFTNCFFWNYKAPKKTHPLASRWLEQETLFSIFFVIQNHLLMKFFNKFVIQNI
jgi:hypothetical protein